MSGRSSQSKTPCFTLLSLLRRDFATSLQNPSTDSFGHQKYVSAAHTPSKSSCSSILDKPVPKPYSIEAFPICFRNCLWQDVGRNKGLLKSLKVGLCFKREVESHFGCEVIHITFIYIPDCKKGQRRCSMHSCHINKRQISITGFVEP